MTNHLNWPSLISAYRADSGLTMHAFAKKVGVTPSTISRWESGKQIPNFKIQSAIRQSLNFAQLRSKEEWIFRVNASSGHEILFDRNDIILAVSEVLVTFHKRRRSQIVGVDLETFFQDTFSVEASVVHAKTRDQMSDDFFSGGLRLIEQISDVRVSNGVVRFSSEFWPVVAGDGEILALIVAVKLGSSPEPDLCKSYRLVSSRALKFFSDYPAERA